jgi:hypothetical protein
MGDQPDPAGSGGVVAHPNDASLEQLEIWCDRVLDATTLDEVFG